MYIVRHSFSLYDASLKGEKQTKWLELCGSNRDHQAQTILERGSVSDLLLRDEDEGAVRMGLAGSTAHTYRQPYANHTLDM
jgi:hypothetical protein